MVANSPLTRRIGMFAQLLLALLVTPFVAYEGVRFYTAHQRCLVVHEQNEALKANRVCSDLYERFLHGDKQDAACRQAEEENRVSPLACAAREMWTAGVPQHVVSMMTESPWMVFGLACTTIASIAWLIARACSGPRRGGPEHLHDTRLALTLLSNMLQQRQQPRYLEQLAPRIELPDDDEDDYIHLTVPRRRKQLVHYN